MLAVSAPVVIEFCKLCNWAYVTWLNHRELFDRNPRAADLQHSLAADTLGRLSVISHEYALLQIIKLHDRAIVAGNVTLSIEYMIRYGGWRDPILTELREVATKLDQFASELRSTRNKVLSHNDLATIIAGANLGSFSDGNDEDYFRLLQTFVDIVHSQVVGGPYPFDDLTRNDVAAFLATLKP
jgi:hypothetical protein